MTPAELHEQHKAAVLSSPREHHDESRDRLVVEALEAARDRIAAALDCVDCASRPEAHVHDLARVRDLATRALAAMGK